MIIVLSDRVSQQMSRITCGESFSCAASPAPAIKTMHGYSLGV